jgi:hypothetical protein
VDTCIETIDAAVKQGFRTIRLNVGANDRRDVELLKEIRNLFWLGSSSFGSMAAAPGAMYATRQESYGSSNRIICNMRRMSCPSGR